MRGMLSVVPEILAVEQLQFIRDQGPCRTIGVTALSAWSANCHHSASPQ